MTLHLSTIILSEKIPIVDKEINFSIEYFVRANHFVLIDSSLDYQYYHVDDQLVKKEEISPREFLSIIIINLWK